MDFANNLLRLLEMRGWKQADLSRATDISTGAINNYIKRGDTPNLNVAAVIARALDVPIESLLTGEVDEGVAPIYRVPILGQIPAGPLAEAIEVRDGDLAVPTPLLPRDGPFFAVRVVGESMIAAGVPPGALAVIRHRSSVANGAVAAVIWDGDATLKRLYVYPSHVILQPANPCYFPVIIPADAAADLRVVGDLVLVVTRFPLA